MVLDADVAGSTEDAGLKGVVHTAYVCPSDAPWGGGLRLDSGLGHGLLGYLLGYLLGNRLRWRLLRRSTERCALGSENRHGALVLGRLGELLKFQNLVLVGVDGLEQFLLNRCRQFRNLWGGDELGW